MKSEQWARECKARGVIGALVEAHRRSIADVCPRLDPVRWVVFGFATAAALAFAVTGSVLVLATERYAQGTALQLASWLCWAALFIWIEKRNDRLLPDALGFPDVPWTEAVHRSRDQFVREWVSNANRRQPHRPIGFRLP